ncbi:MAG TPA: LysE family translocator [Verrucomicrobiae bacterium]|nr:LysE family translocator [Verrucomicrobiae bacterium]
MHSLILFVVAGLALNLTPGPDLLYITARSLGQGWHAGAASALGIAAGCLVHTAAAALGISALLAASPVAYDVLRLAGAAYLVYLGVQALRAGTADSAIGTLAPAPLSRVFGQGFVTNALNPKVALFFLAFLPQFADPARGDFALQVLVLGLIFIFNGLWVCLAVAYGAARAARWLRERGQGVVKLQRASGALLIGLGLHLALGRAR